MWRVVNHAGLDPRGQRLSRRPKHRPDVHIPPRHSRPALFADQQVLLDRKGPAAIQ